MSDTISIEQELQKSYLEYSLSVIIGRAIPDVRDGLKPVHRRILFAMHELGLTYNRGYKKSARVVGDVIGKYHPHGDSAVYDALVRMAQDFNMRDVLVDGQGNFGSLDGDSPAAMRYTECRMAKLASEFLADIEKDTVNTISNYDNTLEEPEVLPARVPNLLVNGASGIAVGMATNIPPHNLGEITDACLHVLDNPECSISDLRNYVQGPDFPTGAYIYGREGMDSAYKTGKGSVRIRSTLEIEQRSRGMECIVVKEIPYALNKANLVEKIAALIQERKIEGISDLRDESDRNGIRIVIDLKKGVISDVVINKLYKFTSLETSFGINIMAVVNNRPQLLNLKEILEYFIEHRKEIVLRRTRHDLKKAEHRAHVLEGLRIALENIDEVVSIIRASKNSPEAKEKLQERFGLSEIQAQAILDMRLHRLTNLERESILEEHVQVLKKIEYYKSILENVSILKGVIREELQELKNNFSTPRRSQILKQDPGSIDMQDLVPDVETVITLSRNGYIKRTPLENYHQQKRGGKGIAGANVSSKDFISTLITTTNHQDLYLFSNRGKMYRIKVYEIPEGSRIARGVHIKNLVPLENEEYIATAITSRDLSEENYFLFYTKKGMVKRTACELYKNIRSMGLIAVGLKEGDELIGVRPVRDKEEVILSTKLGYCIRFNCSDVRPMGRSAAGVKGIALRSGDEVVSSVIADSADGYELVTISEKGFGKKTALPMYRLQSRGGKGIINMKLTKRSGPAVGSLLLAPGEELILLTSASKIIRINSDEVRSTGRSTQGVKMVNLEDDQRVICFDVVVQENEL